MGVVFDFLCVVDICWSTCILVCFCACLFSVLWASRVIWLLGQCECICAYLRAVFSLNFDNLPKRDEKRRCVFVCVFVCTLQPPTGGRNYSHSASVFRRGCLCCFVSFDSPMCDGNMITCVWFSLCVCTCSLTSEIQRFNPSQCVMEIWRCVCCAHVCVYLSVFFDFPMCGDGFVVRLCLFMHLFVFSGLHAWWIYDDCLTAYVTECVCTLVCVLTSDSWWKYDGTGCGIIWLPIRGGHLMVRLHLT